MENSFDDTQPYVVSDLEQSFSGKSNDSTSLGPVDTALVPQKRSSTSECLTSLLKTNTSLQYPHNVQMNYDNGDLPLSSSVCTAGEKIDTNNKGDTNDDNHSISNSSSQECSSPLLPDPRNNAIRNDLLPYDTDHFYDPYTSDSWATQREQVDEEDSLSDLYDNGEDDRFGGSAAGLMHYISAVPARRPSRTRVLDAPSGANQGSQSSFGSSSILSDDSDSDIDSFGRPTSSSSPLQPRPLNFVQRYHIQQQQQRQQQQQDLKETPSYEHGKSIDSWEGNSDATAPYNVDEPDDASKDTQEDKSIIYDGNGLDQIYGDKEDDTQDPSALSTDERPEEITGQLSISDDMYMTQRSSSYGHDSKDDQPEPLCALYDECPVKVLDIENDDTQPLLHHAAMQRLQKGSSRRQSRDQSLSSGDTDDNPNSSSQQKLQQSSLDNFFSQISDMSDLSTVKSFSNLGDSDYDDYPDDTDRNITKASQSSTPSQDLSTKSSTPSSLEHFRVERVKNRSTQSPKDDQHWLSTPRNLPLSSPHHQHSKPTHLSSPTEASRSSKPRHRLPGLSRPRDSSSLVSSASAPSIASMLTRGQQPHTDEDSHSLRPTNVIVKSSSSFVLTPRRKRTLGMSRRRIY